MKYLWIGMLLSDAQQKLICENGGKLLSGYVAEHAIVTGLDSFGIDMDSLNSFPQFSSKVLRRIDADRWSRNGRSDDRSIAFRNVKYLRDIERKRKLKKAARLWAKQHETESVTVFTYCMHSPFMAAAREVKRIIPGAQIVQIIPDLPQYMDMAMSRLKKILKKIDWRFIKRLMRSVDRYILFAEPMAEFLKLQDGRWMLMEGSYNADQIGQKQDGLADGKNVVMYSGVLDLRYGVPELLDAFRLLDDTYELWLTGNGNAVDLIRERAAADARIKFFGYLPSRQDLLDRQASATMLISPRRDTEVASRYCFPSKLFEYMASGNPVISCRLDGIPSEYFDHLIELPTVSPETIADTIRAVAAMPEEERTARGAAGKDFILQSKNKNSQVRKIMDFLNPPIYGETYENR